MIKETGQVVSVEADAVWVETIQQSACQSCVAQKGCGQSLISKATGQTTAIRVLPGQCDLQRIILGDRVTIGIPEHVVVNGTLLVYLLPLVSMVIGVLLAGVIATNDLVVALGGGLGLLAGSLIVRFHSFYHRHNCQLHPILLE